MKRLLILSFAVICMMFSFILVSAQEDSDDCEIDTQRIMSQVTTICAEIGRDTVCYGNTEVDVIPRSDDIDFLFQTPGDQLELDIIRSLYLSEMDLQSDTWGIAQMRLLANLTEEPEDVTLVLFGNVTVEDNSEPRPEIAVENVTASNALVRGFPSTNAQIVDVVEPGERITAVSRLADNTWVRVQVTDTGRVGWMFADLVQAADGAELETLNVETSDSPFLGPMQAFYYQSGTSATCGNLISDGLIIQTPDGVARVTFLINEVNIELLGTNGGASAFIQANPENGMSLNMLSGSANVTAGNQTVTVGANQ